MNKKEQQMWDKVEEACMCFTQTIDGLSWAVELNNGVLDVAIDLNTDMTLKEVRKLAYQLFSAFEATGFRVRVMEDYVCLKFELSF